MWHTHSLLLLPCLLWLRVPVCVPLIGQIELFNCLLKIIIWNYSTVCKLFILDWNILYIELLFLNSNTWNSLTVTCKWVTYTHTHTHTHVWEQDFAWNNSWGLICHKTPTNQSAFVDSQIQYVYDPEEGFNTRFLYRGKVSIQWEGFSSNKH